MNTPFSRAFGCLVDSEAQEFYGQTAYLHTGLTITALFAIGKFFYQAGKDLREIVDAYREQTPTPRIASNNTLTGFKPAALLSPAPEPETTPEPEPEPKPTPKKEIIFDYSELSYKELQGICRSIGVSAKGSKAALLKRIWER